MITEDECRHQYVPWNHSLALFNGLGLNDKSEYYTQKAFVLMNCN